jgi:hypothetical protein
MTGGTLTDGIRMIEIKLENLRILCEKRLDFAIKPS